MELGWIASEQGTAGRRKWWKETNDLHVCFLESTRPLVQNRHVCCPLKNRETLGYNMYGLRVLRTSENRLQNRALVFGWSFMGKMQVTQRKVVDRTS